MEQTYVFMTDSDSDLPFHLKEQYNIPVVYMPYALDGKEYFDDLGQMLDHKSYYDMMRNGAAPVTSALNEASYIEYFEPEFQKGNDICYVHFSAKMTATFGFMNMALVELRKKYPERKFYEIDTKGITLPSLNIALAIGDLILAGKTVDEIMAWADVEVDKFATYFYANDLKFFRKSGRVGGLAAIFGGAIGIRPIITMSSEGKMESIGKEIGKEKALNRLVSYVEELGENIKDYRILIGHCDAMDDVIKLKERLEAKFGKLDNIEIHPVNPTAGSHCGPSTIGVSFHAKHR